MRQLGTLDSEPAARRFAAWLVSQRIDANAEQDASGWVIWVRDEDQLPKAREALAHFREHPQDARYQNAEQSAQAVVRDEEAKRQEALRNIVQMRGRWAAGSTFGSPPRRCPLVMMLIAASILTALLTNLGNTPPGGLLDQLLFFDRGAVLGALEGDDAAAAQSVDMWFNIRRGEFWRLLTPIFVHFGIMHVAMNMIVLYDMGGQIEDRRGWLRLGLLVLVLAVISNAAQAWEFSLWQRLAPFGGMSGVDYGLFGFLLVKVRLNNREHYTLSPGTT